MGIGVTGCVDKIDGNAVDRKRHDRGLDSDPALSLQRQRVGLRISVIDAADRANHAGREEQSFGKTGLTCVDMRQNPEVDGSHHCVSCPLRNRHELRYGPDMNAVPIAPTLPGDEVRAECSRWSSCWHIDNRVIPFGYQGLAMTGSVAARPVQHNVQASGTVLIGRDHDVARLCKVVLQPDRRLVTLTGVGGCGKTRLALRIASQLTGSFDDGVWLVALAPLSDPLLVPAAVASAVGVQEAPNQSVLNGLVAHLSRREVLLVLDNCEHLLHACAELVDTLLQACPRVCVMATSREPLRIAEELAWRVPPLGFPEWAVNTATPEIVKYPAVQLFVERANAVHPGFRLDRTWGSGCGDDLQSTGGHPVGDRARSGLGACARRARDPGAVGRHARAADRR